MKKMEKMTNFQSSVSTISRRSTICLGVALLAATSTSVWAQQDALYPSKPISIVVPMSPGGSTDYVGRTIGQAMTSALGQTVLIDNRAGATGAIGTQYVAKSSPDGYTLLFAPSSVLVMNPLVNKVSYDTARDLKPVGLVCLVEVIIVASKATGFKTLEDLINYAKANPGKLTFGSNGLGSAFHLAGEYLQQLAEIDMLHVPYKGASMAEAALLSNEINVLITNTVSAIPHINAGSIVPLAVASSLGKSRELPDLPLAKDTVPGYVVDTWLGLYSPAGTSDAVVGKLNKFLNSYLQDPKNIEIMRTRGMEPKPGTSAELTRFQTAELSKWTTVTSGLRAAGRLK